MPNIRPTVRRFGPVAPGGGAVIGAGLAGLGQALGAFADVQVEIDRLDQVQFEKVERSEAIAQFTAKQIERNNIAAEILSRAREGRNFESVQQDMNVWETSFNQNLLEGRSQEFRDVFETIDRPARNGSINKLGTAVEAGRLGIVRDNYQIAADNFVESVNALTTPMEINEFFDTYDEAGIGLGFTQAAIDAASGESRRAAMERHIRSLPLVDGLAALSDEDVARALGEDGRETMKRDLTTKARRLDTAQNFVNEVTTRTLGIDVLDSFRQGESATSLKTRIRSAEGPSPTQKKDALDFIDALSIAREKGPQKVDPEVIKTNETLSDKLMDRLKTEAKAINESDSSREDKRKKMLVVVDGAASTYGEAVLKEANGEFGSPELTKLKFKMDAITEPLFIIEDAAKQGFLETIADIAAFALSPSLALSLGRQDDTRPDTRVPNAMVSTVIDGMFLGEGRYGGLSSQDKASMDTFLIVESIKREGSSKPLSREAANAMVVEIFSAAEDRLFIEEKGLDAESAEQVKGLVLNSGEPATAARQQPRQSLLADAIRSGLNQGMTVERIRSQAADMSLFSDEAFDRAVSTMPGIAREPTLEQLGVGLTSESGVDFIRQQEGFAEIAKTVLNESQPTGGFGHFGDFEEGEEVTPERAEELLVEDVAKAEAGVKRVIPQFVKLSENEFNALVSLVFNVGETAFKNSQAAIALNEALSGRTRDEEAIQRFLIEAFDKDKGFVFADGKKIKGLVNRRAAELRLFLGTR